LGCADGLFISRPYLRGHGRAAAQGGIIGGLTGGVAGSMLNNIFGGS